MTGPDPEMTSCRVSPDTNRGGAAPSPSSCTSSRTPLARGLPSRRIPPATASTTLPLALSTLVAYVDRDLRASVFPVNVREAGHAYQAVFLIKDVKHDRVTIVVEALEQPLLIDQTQEAEFPGPPSDCGTVPPSRKRGKSSRSIARNFTFAPWIIRQAIPADELMLARASVPGPSPSIQMRCHSSTLRRDQSFQAWSRVPIT